MDEFPDLTAQYIHQRFKLPKIVSKKIEQANRFINDPSSALKLILQKNNSDKTQPTPNESNTSRTTRVYAHMKRTSTLQLQDLSSERELISEKMRKYKPANGSFSQFYAEQLSIDTSRSNRPKEGSKKIEGENSKVDVFSKQKPVRRKRKAYPSSIQISKFKLGKGNHIEQIYLEKLKQIRENSENLRENSRHLLRKADSVVVVNDHSYEKLADDSNRILTGEQKYVLDLELNDRTTAGHVRWNSKY